MSTSYTRTIASDFFCITFDERTGRSRLPDQLTGMGLAAALISELVISGHASITDAAEISPKHVAEPEESLSRWLFSQLWNNQDEVSLIQWIRYLAKTSDASLGPTSDAQGNPHEALGKTYDAVARRLVNAEVISVAKAKGILGFGQRIVYTPRKVTYLPWPAIRIAGMLGENPATLSLGVEENLSDLVCAGIATATGLIMDHILWDEHGTHARARTNHPAFMRRIPPPLAMVLTCMESAVGDAVLTSRT